MADKPKPIEASAPVEEAAPPRKPSAVMSIIKAVAFVSIIVIVQVVGAAMFIPSGEETAQLAQEYVAAKHGETEAASTHEEDDHAAHHTGEDTVEVELGHFNVTHYNPASNTTLSIDFELYGSVLAKDEAELHHLLEKNNVRVREQVIMTLHSADSKSLSDAGLGLIKRQILEKTNRALGHPMLREVLFSKFNFIER